ncbi:MAG: DUF397 domain-containing protein [Pseudonocardiaceae bacterium]
MTTSSDFIGARWWKASRSASTGDCVELAWRKSSRSATSGACVELAHTEAVFGVRDSKNADGPVLAVTARNGLAFLGAVKNGRLARS